MTSRLKCSSSSIALAVASVTGAGSAARAFDYRIDVCSFYESPEGSLNHFRQEHFDRMNWSSPNGHQIMMGTDQRRSQLTAAGNELGVYHNSLTTVYTNSGHDPVVAADMFRQYAVANHGNTGPVPQWISLNEISSSLWQNSAEYRNWLIGTVNRLHDHYGHEVIVFAPFSNPLNPDRAPDWQAIAAKAYIGVENFLSGEEVKASGFSITWAQQQYQISIDAYGSKGVDPSRLFLTEYFAHTVAGTSWGRAGLPIDEWIQAINVRNDAIRNVGFGGFVGYAWSNNAMQVSDAEMYAAIEAYRSHVVVESEGPKWNVDANGAWTTAGNWASPFAPTPPDGVSEIANFTKPLVAPRNVTVSSPITVGRMTFASPNSYLVVPIGSGSLTLHNNGLFTSITVNQGAHHVSVPIALEDGVNLKINFGALTLSGGLTNPLGRPLIKTGAGSLTISGPQSHAGSATFFANGGTTTFASDGGANLAISVKSSAAVAFGATQRIGALTLAAASNASITPGGAKVLNVASLANSGRLDLADNDLVIRSGTLGSWTGSAYTGVTGQIATGRAGGAWTGQGIVTTQPDAQASLTTLGVALASQVVGISGAQTATWNGQTVAASNVLVMYTYAGDANLDGTIDADDYASIDFNDPNSSASGYANGDFNYDGAINADDYSLIDFNRTVGTLTMAATPHVANVIAIPEPASVALLSVISLAIRHRRR